MSAIRIDKFMIDHDVLDRNDVFRLKYYGLIQMKKYHDYWYVFNAINVNSDRDNPLLPTFNEVIQGK